MTFCRAGRHSRETKPGGQRTQNRALAVLRVPSQASEAFELPPHLQNDDGDSRSACSPGFWAAWMEQQLLTLYMAQNKADRGIVKVCESPVDGRKLKPRGKATGTRVVWESPGRIPPVP